MRKILGIMVVIAFLLMQPGFCAADQHVREGDSFHIRLKRVGRYKVWKLKKKGKHVQFLHTERSSTGGDDFLFRALTPGEDELSFVLQYRIGTEEKIFLKKKKIWVSKKEGKKSSSNRIKPEGKKRSLFHGIRHSVRKKVSTTRPHRFRKNVKHIPKPASGQRHGVISPTHSEDTVSIGTTQRKAPPPTRENQVEKIPHETFVAHEKQDEEEKTQMKLVATEREKEQYILANEIFRRGLYQESILELEDLLKEYPKGTLREATYIRIAESYFQMGKKNLEEARKFRKKRKKDETRLRYSEALNDFDQATKRYRKTLVTFTRGEYMDKNQFYLARSLQLGALAQLEMDEYTRPFTTEIKTHRFDQGVIEYLRLSIRYKNSVYVPDAFFQIGMYYKTLADYGVKKKHTRDEVLENYQKAIKEFEYVESKYPRSDGSMRAAYWTGWIYDHVLVMRNFEKAVTSYRRVEKMETTRKELNILKKDAARRGKIIREKYL